MKKSEFKKFIREEIIEILSEITVVDKNTTPDEIIQISKEEKKDPNTVKQAIDQAKKSGKAVNIAEDIDDDIDTTTNQWKKAEGDEKTALLARLKKLTAIKKELEALTTNVDSEEDMDINPNDSVAKLASQLADTTKEMKTTVNQWKKAEGDEKTALLVRLKKLTAIKKELEALTTNVDSEEDTDEEM